MLESQQVCLTLLVGDDKSVFIRRSYGVEDAAAAEEGLLAQLDVTMKSDTDVISHGSYYAAVHRVNSVYVVVAGNENTDLFFLAHVASILVKNIKPTVDVAVPVAKNVVFANYDKLSLLFNDVIYDGYLIDDKPNVAANHPKEIRDAPKQGRLAGAARGAKLIARSLIG